jgi:hypothetical protein
MCIPLEACPSKGTEMTVPGQPYYFATWTGYEPPVRPHNPIEYERAEASDAFSVFIFDAEGRVASFEKWLVHRTSQDPALVAGHDLAPGVHFFDVSPNGAARPGRVLSLDETKNRRSYYSAHVSKSGTVTRLDQVNRERAIVHLYEYWPNGELKKARYGGASEPTDTECYDSDGQRTSPC